MGFYFTSQICLNGHVIESKIERYAESMENYCSKCGSATITNCQHCSAPIKGDYVLDEELGSITPDCVAGFCYSCGRPYPWTSAALEAAKELIAEMDELDIQDKDKLEASLNDVISETPRTALAATRIKKMLDKSSPAIKEGFKEILYGITVEAAKRLLWP